MRSCPHILYGSETTWDPSVSIQLLHYRLAYFQVVRITCGLEMRWKMLCTVKKLKADKITSLTRQYLSCSH